MTTPDPASGMEMDPEFVRLVRAIWEGGFDCGWNSHRTRKADDSGVEAVRALHEELYRWHVSEKTKSYERGLTKTLSAKIEIATQIHGEQDE